MPLIEKLVGERGYVAVHTSLACEHICHFRIIPVAAQKAFEEGETAVGEVNRVEVFIIHHRLRGFLLHHRRKLLMVADEHEFVDGVAPVVTPLAEQPYYVGFQYLRRFVYDREREMF